MTLQQAYSEIDRAYGTLAPDALERRLKELCDAVAAEHGAESAAAGAMYSELGGFYRGQGRYAESEAAFSTALKLLAATVGAASPDYATALNNLAGTHRLQHQFGKAAAEFAEVLELYRATVGETHVLYASALNNLSLIYLDLDDLDRAEAYLRLSSEVLAQLPACQGELASSLCNLAVLDRRRGRQAEAIGRLQRAIALFEGSLGTDTPHYHAALTTLGLCRRDMGDVPGALEAFRRAADAARHLYGENHHEYRGIMQYLRETEEGSET